MALDRALLKCNHEGAVSVTVNNHVWPVVEGYVLIDVRPHWEAPPFIENPRKDYEGEPARLHNPAHDPRADAEVDAREICAMVVWQEEFGQRRAYRAYEPPSKKERDAWLEDPENLARWEGISEAEARARLAPPDEAPKKAKAS